MERTSGSKPFLRALSTFSLILIISGAIYSAALFFVTVRDVVAQTDVPYAERVLQARSKQDNGPTPVYAAPSVPQLVEQRERVNILLLGIDQRENDPGPWRTDTMILLSIDPSTDSAALLSIPRDLWATIPGYGENRINTAHYLGDYHDYPGGGVALAKKAVWYALGVPVHYYVRINFSGFERAVDAIGGLDIDVPEHIYDETYPNGNYGTMVVDIPAGLQHMDGATALQYARSRHGTSDYGRMERQQQVILAARDKGLGMNIPLASLPSLIGVLGDSIKTDLTLDEIMALAETAQKMDRGNIRHAIISDDMTTTVITPSKAMVEVADWEKVRDLVDSLFPASEPTPSPTPQTATDQLLEEDARIELQNGTLSAGLARETANLLREEGYSIVSYGNADRFDHANTMLIVYHERPYTIEVLVARFGILAENIVDQPLPGSDIDLVLILGRDYAQDAP